ncbi:peptidoglycan editing factor PgeF [Kineococcus sp. TRM81007]|uniref:peptidoglycan editing factor PgeF n=1 Tax=Kineococcus sp. TRM81007 TaxID=2925831 RepID=UPI001F58D9EA|nr:peptidoglycan editing factor PgeF [Kineococcus sp. TRM81007]MCI2239708.1 peptidoglycan editing factor PgeF [Kineococcus sp. TRM81007]
MSVAHVPLLDAGLPAGVRGGFTTRAGAAGDGPFAGLNLGDHVGDDPARVAGHRAALRRAVGADALVVPVQVHGADVVEVDEVPLEAPHADALVTRRRGLALAVVVADCVPVLLADPSAGVVAVAHAGRPGLVAGVVPAVLAAMRAAGARDVRAALGPAVCGSCYEVPREMADEVAAAVPEARATTRWGTCSVDVPAGVLAQLARAGVPASGPGPCTLEGADLYSYRRDGVTGRSAGAVVLA